MFAAPTTYHSGSRVVEVLPGESHSAAWLYVTTEASLPHQRYRCTRSEAGGMVRRRDHASRHRHLRRRRGVAGAA